MQAQAFARSTVVARPDATLIWSAGGLLAPDDRGRRVLPGRSLPRALRNPATVPILHDPDPGCPAQDRLMDQLRARTARARAATYGDPWPIRAAARVSEGVAVGRTFAASAEAALVAVWVRAEAARTFSASALGFDAALIAIRQLRLGSAVRIALRGEAFAPLTPFVIEGGNPHGAYHTGPRVGAKGGISPISPLP